MMNKKNKIVLVLTHEKGISEEPDIKPQEGVKTTITKDYKKGKQITETEIIIEPMNLDNLERKYEP